MDPKPKRVGNLVPVSLEGIRGNSNTNVPVIKDVMLPGINHPIRFYSIGWMALHCNISQQTIRLWETKGVMPRPIYQFNNGVRWYSPGEIAAYARLVRKYQSRAIDLQALSLNFVSARKEIARRYKEGRMTDEYLKLLGEQDLRKARYKKKAAGVLDEVEAALALLAKKTA